jgi:hypothetical protein
MFFFRLGSKFCIPGICPRKSCIVHSLKHFPMTFSPPAQALFINRPPICSLSIPASPGLVHRLYRAKRSRQVRFALFEHLTLIMVGKVIWSRQRRDLVCMLSLLLAVGLSLAPGVWAYEVPLGPSSLHDAWVLGQRNDQATAEFLAPYSQQFNATDTQNTPQVAEIQVLTPFAQVVDQSRQNLSGRYTEQQAVQAYHHQGDTVMVLVRLMLPGAYPQSERSPQAPPASSQGQNAVLRPENFWQNFQFAVKQNGKVLATRSISNKAIYSSATKAAPATLDGQTVWLEYDAKSVAAEEITVNVTSPDAKTITTNFDLKKLR